MPDLLRRAQAIAGNRDAGASELVAELLPLLADAITAGRAPTLAVAACVCAGQPAMAPLWHACAAAVAEHQTPGRFPRARAAFERAPAALARAGAAALEAALVDAAAPEILTLSFSASVLSVLTKVLESMTLRVVCGEGRPRYEGRRMAEALAKAGAQVAFATDAGLVSSVRTATAVVVGADAIASSFWINKAGTCGLAAAAWHHGVPVYVVAARDKTLPAELAARWAAPDEPAAEVWATAPPGVEVVNRYFERIPVELATQFFMDAGPVSPSDVPHIVERDSAHISLLISHLP